MDQNVQSNACDSGVVPVRDLHFPMVESLYIEAMVLADEARTYFECVQNPPPISPHGYGFTALDSAYFDTKYTPIPVDQRVGLACESLKTTTRLMQVISWLLFQRAIQTGELAEEFALAKGNALGDAIPSDDSICRHLPDEARIIIAASEQLYDRVKRLHFNRHRPRDYPPASPVRAMMQQLEYAF